MTAQSAPASRPADQVSPDELLGGFSQGHLARWLLAAVLIHAIVIGGLSVGTIRDWLDPEGAKARQDAAIAAAKASSAAADTPPPVAPAEAESAAATPADATAVADAPTPIEKATTEAAKPGEIPSVPDDLGLSIDDTNPK